MNADRVGQRNLIELAVVVGNQAAIVADGDLAFDRINGLDLADVAVEDFLFVVVFGLDDFVTRPEPVAKAFYFRFAWV